MAPLGNERGQISIFFSASLVVMITIVAFVINVGLFVKAKVNLQNATDAAAFAGASVQARQLTKIAYLNWEMRNIYKEWLYKYYVIGNLNIADVENTGDSGVMKFKLEKDVNVLSGVETEDQFNIPAVCIHIAGSKTNICKRYSVPGLPEFGSSNLPGAEEASRAFTDVLIGTKIADCVDRSDLNMTVATTWTYNVLANSMDESLAGRGPAILSDRQGAWPRAVELALRIRNLEFVMNRPAETGKVCANGSTNLTNCTKAITAIEQERKLGNERLVKAFYSGYRNLGNEDDSEMKSSFTLTELPPKKVSYPNEANASNLLIPKDKQYEKQWVDLKLMMVNYSIFYAAMFPRNDDKTSGACDVSKVAIPVPGYPLGFYKDPDVLTYYAVRGEAEFIGMFNPFTEGPVMLTAYAAAKPMGGRIGPMLFTQKPNENFIVGRTDALKLRSLPYMTSYKFDGVTIRGKLYSETAAGGLKFIPGLPLPTNSTQAPGSFWLESPDKPLGGKLADAGGVQFGVPNLVYDYEVPFRTTGYSLATERIHIIDAKNPSTEQPVGLYAKHQFKKFKGTALSPTISPADLDAELARIKAPTLYEAANYLIPTPNDALNLGTGLDSFGFISDEEGPVSKNGIDVYRARIYAPLFKANDQVDVLYNSAQEVLAAIYEFMGAQETGMTKYKMAMNKAALAVFKEKDNLAGGAQGAAQGVITSAKGISDIDFDANDITLMPASCASLSGRFLYFYYGGPVRPNLAPANPEGCPKPLGTLLQEYFSGNLAAAAAYDPTYYRMEYSYNKNVDNLRLLTAYMPGPFTGADFDGSFVSPLTPDISDKMRRNFYSTKFVTLDSVQAGGGPRYDNSTFLIHSEGAINPTGAGDDAKQTAFRNALDTMGADLSSIKY
jgi:hypothetical protein